MFFTLMKTQDWVETSVLLDNDICPTISASGVSLSITLLNDARLSLIGLSNAYSHHNAFVLPEIHHQ